MNVFSATTFVVPLLCIAQGLCAQRAFSDDVLRNPNAHSQAYETIMDMEETPVFQQTPTPNTVLLENGYAQYRFENPGEWPPQGKHVKPLAVKVIFTKYPKDQAFWLTDYHWLLSKRLQALFSLDSNLNAADIEYSMLLQTDCDNEFETMQLFHGIEVTYAPIPSSSGKRTTAREVEEGIEDAVVESTTKEAAMRNKTVIKKLNLLMYREQYHMDSMIYKIMDRNRWGRTLLVLDWTGSMYGYGAEALVWQALHEDSSNIGSVAFFNDGNATRNRKKVIGYTGGVYVERTSSLTKVMRTMRKVQKRGNGGDSPENDIEAMVSSLRESNDVEDIILIADNNSCIRDFVLLKHIDRPVHVILCGTKRGINHQYINLAWRTGGSLHTPELDLDSIQQLLRQDSLVIKGVQYTLTSNNVIMPLDRAENFYAHCDRYYQFPRRHRKRKQRHKDPKCYFTE